MSIRCVCQNGHVLNVKETLAGTSGLCPRCRTRVKVPDLRAKIMSEDAILHLLEDVSMPPQQSVTQRFDPFADTTPSGFHGQSTPNKCCDRCNKDVPAGSHICPHCHTYIANLKDF
jgi:hypothetical protein